MLKPCYRILLFLLLLPLSPFATAEDRAVIFMYHRFAEDTIPTTNIRLEQFDAQISWLKEQQFNIWPLKKIITHLQQGQTIPDKTIAITMDDAYRSVFTHAYPRLKAMQWPFTIFVSTNYIDRKYQNYMTWEQMRTLRADGVDFANHTATHSHLIRHHSNETPQQWRHRIKADIELAQKRLIEELGEAQKFLAYPYGEYNQTIQSLVTKMGYTAFGQHSGAIGKYSDFTALPRYPISENYGDLPGFTEKALSLPLALKSMDNINIEIQENRIPPISYTPEEKDIPITSINCFATGEGRIEITLTHETNSFTIPERKQSSLRRSRYNCTATSNMPGRYYWHSQLWINPQIEEDDDYPD